MKLFVSFVLFLFIFGFTLPAQAQSIPYYLSNTYFNNESFNNNIIDLTEPVKVYEVSILPKIPKQIIHINPSANKLSVMIRQGDIFMPCGDNHKIYVCKSGEPLIIDRNLESSIEQFWVHNNTNKSINIKISVYDS
ncbi:MAG: hypothetical protein AAF208_01320 [Cyanobacteria bacterium P01_A01_bin.45]